MSNAAATATGAFPLLKALKDLHLILAEGAHNQFGHMAWTARSEMLTQQWILSRPEFHEFLGGRAMVPYPEPWMDRIDTMKQIQGWGDASVTHFRDLAVFGEKLLLSVRYGNWSTVSDVAAAKNWARFWRQEVKSYMHSYRAVTGVDLGVDARNPRDGRRDLAPAVHLRSRMDESRRRNASLPPRALTDPSEVVATYRAAWNEPDQKKRTALLEASFAGDGVYQDPTGTAEGCAALAMHIGEFHGQYPDHSIDQASRVDVTPGGLRWAWVIRNGEGVVIEGVDFAQLAPDGRLQRIAAFFGPLLPLT